MMKAIKLAIFLAVIAGLSGLCMSAVNDMTSPIIEKQAMAKVSGALEEIFPGADFSSEEVTDKDYVTAIYTCDDGVVYNCTTTGYGGDITFLIGMDNDGKYVGFVCTDCSSETAGLGARVGESAFKEQVETKDVDTQIDTISGSTISSSAVQRAIDEAAEMFKSR